MQKIGSEKIATKKSPGITWGKIKGEDLRAG